MCLYIPFDFTYKNATRLIVFNKGEYMKILILALLLMANIAKAETTITGYWTTIDDETNTAKSVVKIYEYNGKYFGRVVELLKNKQATAKLPNNPPVIEMDIIWDLEKEENTYKMVKFWIQQKAKFTAVKYGEIKKT